MAFNAPTSAQQDAALAVVINVRKKLGNISPRLDNLEATEGVIELLRNTAIAALPTDAEQDAAVAAYISIRKKVGDTIYRGEVQEMAEITAFLLKES